MRCIADLRFVLVAIFPVNQRLSNEKRAGHVLSGSPATGGWSVSH